VFPALADGKPAGQYVVFADGFSGAVKDRVGRAPAVGTRRWPDGALYIGTTCTDASGGRLSGRNCGDGGRARLAPPQAQYFGCGSVQQVGPPEASIRRLAPRRRHPADSPGPRPRRWARRPGLPRQVGGATCVGCHGSDAKGTRWGRLTSGTWLWGDGSLRRSPRRSTDGVRARRTTGPRCPRWAAHSSPFRCLGLFLNRDG